MAPWSNVTAGNPNAWIPFRVLSSATFGVDFAPICSATVPYRASTHRPAYTYELSSITAAGFAGEGKP
jgi:hypothetical protein